MIALLKRGSDFLIGQPPLHGGVQLAGLDDRLQVGDGDVLLCDDLVPLGDPVVELVKLGCMAPRIGIAVFQADQQPGPIQAGVISIAKVSFRRAVTNVAFAALAKHMVTG